jgi:hypothetical protein
MLFDYAPVIAPVIAIVNSVIAVSVAHFRPENQRMKLTFLSISIVLGLVAASGTILGQYIVMAKQTAEANKRTEIHKRLGELIAQGDSILLVLRDPSKPLPMADVNAWAILVEQYLSDALGPGFIEWFRDSSGLLHGEPTGIDVERTNTWNGIYERVARLQQFSAETSK